MQSIHLLAGALAIMTACASDDTVPAKPAAAEKDARWLVYEGDAEKAPGHGRRIVMVSGDEEYRSEEGLPMLGRMLAHHGFEAVVLFSQDPETGEIDPENLEHIPGLIRDQFHRSHLLALSNILAWYKSTSSDLNTFCSKESHLLLQNESVSWKQLSEHTFCLRLQRLLWPWPLLRNTCVA